MADCIFCKIVNKEIPAQLVYEDDMVVAFNDINPVAPTHILVIPKKHIKDMVSVTEEDTPLMGHILKTIQKIANDRGMDSEGYRIVNNCRELGGQTVHHLHFHLLGQREMKWPPG